MLHQFLFSTLRSIFILQLIWSSQKIETTWAVFIMFLVFRKFISHSFLSDYSPWGFKKNHSFSKILLIWAYCSMIAAWETLLYKNKLFLTNEISIMKLLEGPAHTEEIGDSLGWPEVCMNTLRKRERNGGSEGRRIHTGSSSGVMPRVPFPEALGVFDLENMYFL